MTRPRIKIVFSPSSMVAHVWAQQTQDHGRNTQGNFYFNGDTIYSYGTHYPIARIVTHKGKKCVLFNRQDSTVTTSGHKADVRRALGSDSGPVFPVCLGRYTNVQGTPNHKENLVGFKKSHIEFAQRVERARSNREWLMKQLEHHVAKANEYSQFFGLKTRFSVPNKDALAAAVLANKRANDRANAKARKIAEQRKAEQALRLRAWIAGDNAYFRSSSDEVSLRLKTKDGKRVLETSAGAEVPLRHAIKVLPLIRSGKSYERNGHTIHLGNFALDRIDAEGNVKAGCHTISRKEIERVASLLTIEDLADARIVATN